MQTLLISTRKGLFEAKPVDGVYKIVNSHFLGDPVTYTFSDERDKSIYAALQHGHFGPKLHRSDDEGATWKEIGTPTYPDKPEGSEDKNEWSLKSVWSLASAGPDKPGALWCGTIPGGLFYSEDRGESWELCEGLWNHPDRLKWFGGGSDYPAMHSVVVDPRDSQRVLVAISCGGVWETLDRGTSWTARAEGMRADFMPPERAGDPTIQDPHLVVACRDQPDHLWTQHHCGIWKSEDGAKSWSEVKKAGPSTFGFAVAVHPEDPNTAWFVPAVSDEHRIPVDGKVVVTRTRDGGKTFDVLTSGLPQEHAYDLCFRHALDIEKDGSGLAFGTTTGSVWTTDDQGDHWHLLTANLPPVYALQYV
jgi:photosystem II stability/assembly factor-like uncharacterized protein